jgi:4-amino-4-deoxy-L-arabinose transferase-like glycosyltransferase
MNPTAGRAMPATDGPGRPPAIVRSDGFWVCFLAVSFALDIVVTWRLWGTAVLDCGREMNQPLRLLNGEMLYSDVRHIYGPLSPYLNALLFWLFGPSLDVLYAAGIVCAALIVALVYRIARRFLEPEAAAAAASIVIWTCVVNQWSSYILPYTYAGVHGCLFGLLTLELLLAFIASESRHEPGAPAHLISAGIAAGLATLAKTEMGFVALATGCVAIGVTGAPHLRRMLSLAARFLLPAFLLVSFTYLFIAMRVGVHTLVDESFLLVFFSHFPAELLYFNRKISGMDDVTGNAWRMLFGMLRLGLVGGLILATGSLAARLDRLPQDRSAPRATTRTVLTRVWGWLSAALPFVPAAAGLRVLQTAPILGKLRWGQGVLRGLPILLCVVLVALLWRFWQRRPAREESELRGLIVLFFYAAASLSRVVLRVTIETAYAAMLLPTSIIALAYVAAKLLAQVFRGPAERKHTRHAAVVFLFAYALWSGALLAKVCVLGEWLAIESPRGTMRSLPEHARAINGAMEYVLAETRPGDPVACLPECTAINFFTDRRNPLREEIVSPGYLDREGESRAIARLEETNTRLVLIENRPTTEFGVAVFGRDYCQPLMAWIDQHFEPVATFGDATSSTPFGAETPFFVRAYRHKDSPPPWGSSQVS